MSRTSLIIAIDGYSSTGKSSFAKKIAARYGLLYLDSGALYRAVTLAAMKNGLLDGENIDKKGLSDLLGRIDVHFGCENGQCITCIDGSNVEKEIRSMDVSEKVSMVAACGEVRNFVDSILHGYGEKGGVIMDGRDIGTTVFPNADIKIFMVADPDVRAARRLGELKRKGVKATFEEVKKNLLERDWNDSHRSVSPLTQAPDAILLDNTMMNFDDQMAWIDRIVKGKR